VQGHAAARVISEDLDKTLTIPRSGVPYSDEVLPPSLTLIALYRSNLSHRWDEADKSLAKAHYFLSRFIGFGQALKPDSQG
jgi:hypothetical protein